MCLHLLSSMCLLCDFLVAGSDFFATFAARRFNILYDDGDREPNVKAKYVRQRGSGPALSPAAAALAAATGGGGSAAGMDLLSSMMEAMMQGVEDQYTPRDAAIVEVSRPPSTMQSKLHNCGYVE